MPGSNATTVTVDLPHGRGYPIHFATLSDAPRLFDNAGLRRSQALLITDENVAELYIPELEDALTKSGWSFRTHAFEAGERSKSAETINRLYDWALEHPIDRQTPVIALGGGVVGDVAGYIAATLLRGLPLVLIPTSLVGQADSSIGGKTGINHAKGKNLIGVFHQPALVLVDSSTLSTLPSRDFNSGLAEVVKHALIADATFFDWLDSNWDDILQKKDTTVGEMVFRAASIKASIVAEDEREAGKRKLLNFGHTFGHAIERAAGYGAFTHGEAIAIGMRAALHLSGFLQSGARPHGKTILPAFTRADALLARIPIDEPIGDLEIGALVDAMQTDKKRNAAQLQFVVLRAIGDAAIAENVSPDAVQAAWTFALEVSRIR